MKKLRLLRTVAVIKETSYRECQVTEVIDDDEEAGVKGQKLLTQATVAKRRPEPNCRLCRKTRICGVNRR